MSETRHHEARYRAADIPGGAPLVPQGTPPVGLGRRIGRAFRSWLNAAAVTLGVMYVAGWFVVTFGVAASARYVRTSSFANAIEKSTIAEAMRPYALPRDASIDPARAGLAFARMQLPEKESPGFPLRVTEPRGAVPWEGMVIPAGLFPSARPSQYDGPNVQKILEAAARGLNARELAVLRTIATAPVWADFDVVIRAPAADLLGARFQVPFTDAARPYAMPIIRFSGTKALAYAGVSRAAYHLAEGRRGEAESILRGIISFGFVMKDNATWMIDELIANVVIGIGRTALVDFYQVTGNPRGAEIADAHARVRAVLEQAAPPAGPGAARPRPALWNSPVADEADNRKRLIATVASPDASRALRVESLMQLALSSCGNVRELVAGPGADIRDAFDGARRDLARYPSERALVDLIEQALSRGLPDQLPGAEGRLYDAVRIAEVIYFNPRLGMCALRGMSGVL